jgi:uncharacterized membrane protein
LWHERADDDQVNIVLTVVVIALVWSAVSILVALAIGAMAKARDEGARLTTPELTDERARAAV